MHIVCLNGAFIPLTDALLHCDERGFRFGDGVFETIPVHYGAPYLLAYHLQRLEAGLNALSITCDLASLPPAIDETIKANRMQEGIIRLSLSRGGDSRGYLPADPAAPPTCLIQPLPLPLPLSRPISLWLSRWQKPSPLTLPTACKLAQGMNATLARMEAEREGCDEALQLSAEGMVSEASAASLFWIAEDRLHTPPLGTGALAGVTRRRIMENPFCEVVEAAIPVAALASAQAVFLTNASRGVVEVSSLRPLELHWQSHPLVKRLSNWRTNDIETHCPRR